MCRLKYVVPKKEQRRLVAIEDPKQMAAVFGGALPGVLATASSEVVLQLEGAVPHFTR